MFEHPYFKKTGTFRFNGEIPKSPLTPFHKSEKRSPAMMASYECGVCKYSFKRKADYKGSLSRCPYCGKDGSVNVVPSADELLRSALEE